MRGLLSSFLTSNNCCGSSLCGRFRYSDLKEPFCGVVYVFFIGLRRVVWIVEVVLLTAWVGRDLVDYAAKVPADLTLTSGSSFRFQ